MRTLSALVLTAALAIPAFAQPPGGGRGGMRGGMGGAAMLLGVEDVQKELKITDEQKTKIKDFTTKQTAAMREAFGGGGAPDREKMQEMMKKAGEESKAFLKDALTEEQNKRLNQISLQNSLKTMPSMAFANEDTAKALKITDEQKEKLTSIGDQLRKDMAELRPMGRERPSADAQKKMDALRKESTEKIMEVLTEDQHKTLKELQGKPFEGKIELGRPGGGRPGGAPGAGGAPPKKDGV